MSCSLEPLVPFAAGHEIIRQGRQDLELIAPDLRFALRPADRRRLRPAGDAPPGSATSRRARPQLPPRGRAFGAGAARDPRPLQLLGLAGALGGRLGIALHPDPDPARVATSSAPTPTSSVVEGAVRVPALKPDLAILHVQRADAEGRAHGWGPLGIAEEAALAAAGVILSCEELVDPEVILSDPNRVLVAESKVVAVVHEPGRRPPGAGPGLLAARPRLHARATASGRGPARAISSWLQEWVLGVEDRAAYLRRLGDARRHPRPPSPPLGAGGLRR